MKRLGRLSLALSALMLIALPQAAHAGWVPVGGQLSTSGQLSYSAHITQLNGTPWAAWIENTGPSADAKVASFNGSTWVQRPNPMNSPATRGAEVIDIATIGGSVYVVFAEGNQPNAPWPEILVKRWNGSAWVAVGTKLNVADNSGDPGSTYAHDPQITGLGATPCVTWWETPPNLQNDPSGKVYVKCFNGSVWNAVGGALNTTSANNAHHPTIENINTELHVAWIENLPGVNAGSAVYVAKRTGSAWVPVGQALQTAAGDVAGFPDLAQIGTTPYVAWSQNDPDFSSSQFTGARGFVARLNVNSWDFGGAPITDARYASNTPLLASVDGDPWVAHSEADLQGTSPGSQSSVRVRRPDEFGMWPKVEGVAPIKKEPQHASGPGDLLQIGDDPYVIFVSGNAIWVSRWYISVVNTIAPSITGTPAVGQTLTCNYGTWTNTGDNNALFFQPQWETGARDEQEGDDVFWNAISIASESTYTVRPEDAGRRVRCRVNAQNSYDNVPKVSQSVRTDTAVAVNTTRPSIEGTGVTGTEHRCNPGTWSTEGDFEYRWLLAGDAIPDATEQTYTPPRIRGNTVVPVPDPLHRLTCEVLVRNGIGPSNRMYAPELYLVDDVPINYSIPEVTGDLPDASPAGRELTCRPGVWTDDYPGLGIGDYRYEYQWLRNGVQIAGAINATYTTGVDDLGTRLSCWVYSNNPAGRSAPEESVGRLVPLPAVTSGGEMMTATGTNQYVPINMMAIGRQYKTRVDQYILGKLSAAKNAEVTRCRSAYTGNNLTRIGNLIERVVVEGGDVDERERCAILLLRGNQVSVYPDGVKFMDACRAFPSNYLGRGGELSCVDLGFAIPPVDPDKPPPLDFPDAASLAAVTPTQILWDVNNDGLTDASCPGTAPVMRAMLNVGQWNPRAIIVYPDSVATGVFSEARAPGPFTNPPRRPAAPGTLRDAQPLMCRTSLAQPPNPQSGPCVTEGAIGRVRVTGNLCPISIRTMSQAQIDDIRLNNPQLIPVLEKFAADAERKEAGGPRPRSIVYAEAEEEDLLFPRALRPRGGVPGLDGFTEVALENYSSARASLNETGQMMAHVEANLVPAPTGLPSSLKAGDAANFALDQMYISTGAMKVNGITVEPTGTLPGLILPTDVKEGLDLGSASVKQMKVLVEEAKTRLGSFVTGEADRIEAEFKESAKEAAEALLLKNGLVDKIREFKVGPLGFHGAVNIKLNPDQTATITAKAEIPLLTASPKSGPIHADAVLSGDREGNIKLESIEASVIEAYLFGIEIHGLKIRYDGGLSIKGQIKFGKGAGSSITIHNFRINPQGGFEALAVEYQAPAGAGINVATGIFLVGIRGGYDDRRSLLEAGATFTIGPSTGGCPAFGLTGTIFVSWPSYIEFKSVADIVAACIPLAQVTFLARTTGYVELKATVNFREGPVFINGGIGGTFDATQKYANTDQPKWQIEARARGGIKDVPIVGDISATVQGVLSNSGLAVCGEVEILGEEIGAGVGVRFNNGVPPLFYVDLVRNLRVFTGCSLGSWRVLPSIIGGTRAHAAQAGTTFEIADGQRAAALAFPGAGDPPKLRLRSPDGKVYDFTDAIDGKRVENAYGVQIEEEDRTVVLLARPAGGRWSVELGEASPALVRVETAPVLPDAQVRGRVSGVGSSRVLRYDVRRIPGQQVRLIEQAKGAHRELRTIRGGGKGRIRFRTAEADTNRRRILAEVTQDGMPRTNIEVTKFTAPNPKIGRARKVRVRRRGRNAVVTWRKAALAERYDVIAQTGDGGTILLRPQGRRLRVTVPDMAKAEGAIVRVVGISPSGRRGPAARARLKGTMKLGAAKPKKPRKRRSARRRRG